MATPRPYTERMPSATADFPEAEFPRIVISTGRIMPTSQARRRRTYSDAETPSGGPWPRHSRHEHIGRADRGMSGWVFVVANLERLLPQEPSDAPLCRGWDSEF
jgi:hypothetical protein